MCEKEIAYQLTRIIKQKAIKGDKGNTSMIEWYIYINGLYTTVKNIENYGLFPQPSSQMETRAPSLFLATKHTTSNRTDGSIKKFRQIYDHIVLHSDIPIHTYTKRAFSTELFPKAQKTLSSWVPFDLHYIHLLKTITSDIPTNPLFNHGNYLGTKNPCERKSPMDNNFLTSINVTIHKINNISDLAIINSAKKLLDKEHIAYTLFQFKEQRNEETDAVTQIKHYTDSWFDHQPDKVFNVTINPRASKTQQSPATKKGKNTFDMNNYMNKDEIIPIVSNFGQHLSQMKKTLAENQETLPHSLSPIPSIVHSLWTDLKVFTSHRALGGHATIEEYMTTYPVDDGDSSDSSNASNNDSDTTSNSDDDSADSSDTTSNPNDYDDDATPQNNSIARRVTKHHKQIKDLVPTSENIKSSFGITTDDDLTPADDDKIKYLIFSVPDISTLHQIWKEQKVERSDAGTTTTLPGNIKKGWMEGLLMYLTTLQQTWTVNLNYLDVNPATPLPSTIAIVETVEFGRNIVSHLQLQKEASKQNNSSTTENVNESPSNGDTTETTKKKKSPAKKRQASDVTTEKRATRSTPNGKKSKTGKAPDNTTTSPARSSPRNKRSKTTSPRGGKSKTTGRR